MCPQCAAEYGDPANRRFHAQPNACPVCGPQLHLVNSGTKARRHGGTQDGIEGSSDQGIKAVDATAHVPAFPPSHVPTSTGATAVSAVSEAARLLQNGAILAVKGIGGYHLACRADREDVVRRLRERKLRDGKPLAVMAPHLVAARQLCRLTPADADALTSPAAPIVLAPKADGHGLAASIAPGCEDFGVMLPYAPLHHLLFAEGLGPLVMTSANLAGQPLTYRDDDALADLADVADAFLVHNREIFRPIDDSVVFTFRDEVIPIRRARGYAPRPIRLQIAGPRSRPQSKIQNPKSKIASWPSAAN
jgi:hydrogenase maturation protein HypF